MEIKPIEIFIKDIYLLSQIAPFLDSDKVLKEIQAIREEKLHMSKLYNRNLIEELYKYNYGFALGLVKKPDYLYTIKKLEEKIENVSEFSVPIDKLIDLSMFEVKKLLIKYNKNLGYMMAMVYSILTGIVKEDDYTSNTHALLLTPETVKGVLFEPPFSYVTLIISPESTLEEVQTAFKQAYSANYYRKRKPFKVLRNNKLKSIATDTSSGIVNNRQWYWMNHVTNSDRMGYRKIGKTTGLPVETIIGGINAYKKLLRQYI